MKAAQEIFRQFAAIEKVERLLMAVAELMGVEGGVLNMDVGVRPDGMGLRLGAKGPDLEITIYVDKPGSEYHDDRSEMRNCDRCGKLYTGPTIFCSRACAEEAA